MRNQSATLSAAGEALRGSPQSGLRAQNERLVLTLIRQNGPLSKAEIARISGLSAQTVSVIMRALEADGVLEKCEPVRGKVGQPQVPMRLARSGAFFFGLKVGRRSLDLILTDFLGKVLSRVHLTHRYPTPDGVVRFAHDAIGQLRDQLTPTEQARIAGLGIAIPFRLWDWARPLGVQEADMAAWRDRDIRAEIAGQCDFPVYLQNDASAACGAELVFGATEDLRDFLYFFVGFFIGGGVVLNRTLCTGRSGNAGALGSMPVGTGSGRLRQLVDVASLSVLDKAVQAAGGSTEAMWEMPQGWDLPEPVLSDWIEGAATGLAHAIAASASVIDFEAAVIDGWLPPELRARLVEATGRRLAALIVPGIDLPRLRPGTIGSDARALGAASLPLSDRFLLDQSCLLS
ncbi:ROK family transcriptional regulator [Acidimangrovimonas pyrenivorans]|uniref:ROK family transcriptional regulator n=1 Tax=Acidimangrovimonas pyrenivorans TaxID=2030798 RepID=A0ABV7AK17_9RHOB